MVHIRISDILPKPEDLLTLDVEELAGVLLVHLNSAPSPDQGVSVYKGNDGKVNYHGFCQSLHRNPIYKSHVAEVRGALMEAWAWLQSEGFLVPDENWFFLSRRAQRLKSRKDFEDYRKAHLLPKAQMHPLIASRVYPPFLRGEYDTAIFQAFREIEVAVRQAGQFPQSLIGEKLMRAAFNPVKNNRPAGPLADPQLPSGEQEAMANLFAGAFGVYRNSTGHRHVPTKAEEAAEVIMFASQLLRIVDRVSG